MDYMLALLLAVISGIISPVVGSDDPCASQPCLHEGTCEVLGSGDFRCTCPSRFTGKTCESEVTCGPARDFLHKNNATLHKMDAGMPLGYEMPPGSSLFCKCLLGHHVTEAHEDLGRHCFVECTVNGERKMNPCVPYDCGQPAPINNALPLKVNNTLYSAEAQYECEPGFNMAGSGVIYCSDIGWSGRKPVCYPIPDCGEPPSIDNGEVIRVNSTDEFGRAEYRCTGSAEIVGDGVARYCLLH